MMRDIPMPPAAPLVRRFTHRYDRDTRRLYVSGSNFYADLGTIKYLLKEGRIRVPVETLVYTFPDGTIRILRGRFFDEGIG